MTERMKDKVVGFLLLDWTPKLKYLMGQQLKDVKNLESKEKSIQKNLCQKEIWVKKVLGLNKFLVKKNFV